MRFETVNGTGIHNKLSRRKRYKILPTDVIINEEYSTIVLKLANSISDKEERILRMILDFDI